jgi:PAS domain S-box-containing protein
VAASVVAVALIFLAVWIIVLRRQIARRVKAEVERNRYFDLSLDMLCVAGFDGKFRELNPAWQKTLGWSIAEMKQAPWLSLVHPEDREGTIRAGEKLSRGEAVLGFENRYRCKDGTYKWLSWNSYPLPEEKLMFGAIRDITERKKSEEALRESEEKYRSIVDHIVEGIYQSTPDGKYLSVNNAQARLYGYDSPEEMIEAMTDISTQLYVDAQDHRRITGLMEKFDQVVNFEFQARRKDGSTLWVSQNARAVRDDQGKILYYEGTNIDITERKKTERELVHAYQLNKQIIASVAEGLVIFDRNLCYRMWNPFMEKITGVRESDLLGKKLGEYFPPIKAYGIEEILRRILAGEILHFPPFPYDAPQSSKKRWAEVACSHQLNEQNEVIGVIVSVREVTEKRQMEERLQRAEKMEALGMLAGGVAHDLNNVIGISIGYSEMMLDDLEPDSPLRGHVESIMQATERAAAIVQDMLTMARRGVPVSKVINLNTIVTDFLEEPELAAMQALHPNVDIKTVLSPDLLNISGSPVHLTKTVMNLITNAAEAIRDHGVICVSTQNVHLDRPVKGYDSFTEGDYAVLSVSDTGEGIPAENLPHIFEPFYTKKVMGRSGTGLGLAVVWGTLKDHNGYIDVKSQPGQGTVFSLYFPVVREELTAGPEFTDRLSYLGKSETILVVDDVPEQRELATRLLGKLNYLPASVGSGEEAVEFIKKSRAALVVLDMIMDPGIDGLETYRRILEVRPGQKAIIVSGFAETERVSEAQRLGAGAYVKKPYLTETLGTAVRQELDRNGEGVKREG